MNKLLSLTCAIIAYPFFASVAWADSDCEYKLSIPAFNYTVMDENPAVSGSLSIAREKDNGQPCSNYFLTFSRGQAGNYNRYALNSSNGEKIYYNLYKNSNATGALKELNDISSNNETLYGPIAKDQTIALNYFVSLAPINASNPPLGGIYTDVIRVRSYSGTYSGSNDYEGYRDLYININVPKSVSLSLVDTGDSYDSSKTSKTLDFGILEKDEELSFDVRIVSNAGYILKISSANNGELKRIDGSGSKSEIDYDFYANNSKKSLSSSSSSPVTIASASGKTPSGGARIPIRVVIDEDVDDKDPGTYQDYLTLSVISND